MKDLTTFVVTDLGCGDVERCIGSDTVFFLRYTATLRGTSHQIKSDGECGEGEITLARTKRPFPWIVGQTIEIEIPWGGDTT